MLLMVATSLLMVWGFGMATSHTLGGGIYMALFFAGVAFFLRFLTATSNSYSR